MSAQSWRIATDFGVRINHMDKRLMHEERRPAIGQASDLLGPGAAPFAVQISDWDEDAAAFTGVFYSDPEQGQVHAPDDLNSSYWIGETFGTLDGFGFQRLTQVYAVTGLDGWPNPTPLVYRRHFASPGGMRLYSNWQAI